MYTYFFSHDARSIHCLFSLLKGAFIDVQDAPAYVKVVPQFGRNKTLLPHGLLEDERSVSCLNVSSYLPTCTMEPPLSSHSGAPFGGPSGAALWWLQWSQWVLPWAATTGHTTGWSLHFTVTLLGFMSK